MVAFVGNVIFVGLVNLHGWVLGINLAFYKALQRFWHPYVKTDLAINRGNLEAKMLLNTAIKPQLFFVAQNTMKARKQLFGSHFGFVVSFWYLENKQGAFDSLDGVDTLVIAPRKVP